MLSCQATPQQYMQCKQLCCLAQSKKDLQVGSCATCSASATGPTATTEQHYGQLQLPTFSALVPSAVPSVVPRGRKSRVSARWLAGLLACSLAGFACARAGLPASVAPQRFFFLGAQARAIERFWAATGSRAASSRRPRSAAALSRLSYSSTHRSHRPRAAPPSNRSVDLRYIWSKTGESRCSGA